MIDTPALDAALLLAETLHKSREELFIRENEPVTEKDSEKYFSLLERRKKGECIAYILGRKEFRGLEFIVNPHVLVPRPDTETLAEAAIEYIKKEYINLRKDTSPEQKPENDKTLSLLDLCTGSGVLAISLKNECPFLRVTASDISAHTLETAALNATRLLEDGRFNEDNGLLGGPVRFIESDLFEKIPGRFNIIVSNPPYVPSDEIDALAPEVRREPRLALDGGCDGMETIRKIIIQAPEHLFPGGVLLLEAAPEQMPAIRIILESHCFAGITIHRDLAGRDRVISAITS